jgi:spore germination cell wall hydrolase CwlJ-like protein|nr:MAG TPA: lytic transglycosylase [Caudoviricetes sp.]
MKKFIGALVAVGLAATAYSAEAKPHKVKKSKHKPHKVVKLHKKHKVKKHPRIKKHVRHVVVKHHLKKHVKNTHQKVVKEEVNVSPNSEVDMLALAIHNEARGEPRSGKYAVANVILNRVKHKSFPNTVRKVVTQRGQFQWYHNHKLRSRTAPTEEARAIARDIYQKHVSGRRVDNTGGSIFFSSNGVRPAPRAIKSVRVGHHQFYRIKT